MWLKLQHMACAQIFRLRANCISKACHRILQNVLFFSERTTSGKQPAQTGEKADWKKAKQNSRLPALISMSLLILCRLCYINSKFTEMGARRNSSSSLSEYQSITTQHFIYLEWRVFQLTWHVHLVSRAPSEQQAQCGFFKQSTIQKSMHGWPQVLTRRECKASNGTDFRRSQVLKGLRHHLPHKKPRISHHWSHEGERHRKRK